MEEFAPYNPSYEQLKEATVLRFKIDKLLHSFTNEQLADVLEFIATVPAPKVDYKAREHYRQVLAEGYEPFTPRFLKVV